MNAIDFTDMVSKLAVSTEMPTDAPGSEAFSERMLDSLIGLARSAIGESRRHCPERCQHQRRERCRRFGSVAEGVVYDEDLAGPDGMAFTLLPDLGMKGGKILVAKAKLRTDRDVVGPIEVVKWKRCDTCESSGWVAR